MNKRYPRIYLAMDNCVLYKRWTRPDEWARVIKGLGVNYIEASADTEMDPLYMGADYLPDWVRAVKAAEAKHGVKVSSLYSGHGSYTTLGLAHPDARVRRNMSENFFFPMLRMAGELGCGVGFFAHAFENQALQSPETYAECVEILTEELCRLSRCAAEVGGVQAGIERMYTPHQYPWRDPDIADLLRAVKARSGHDFYYTEDLGHHHTRFQAPTDEAILNSGKGGVWLGTDRAFDLAEADAAGNLEEIKRDIAANPQLFAQPSDGDCYVALRTLGCYSPIVHLQQTPGALSSHLPFTEKENARGVIRGDRVLKALKESYDRPEAEGMPARCEDIYLTLELFSGTTSIMRDVLRDCRTSVEYWRQFIPEDGLTLDALVKE